MKTRAFDYRFSGVPGVLAMLMIGVVLLGLIMLVVMVGAAVAVGGLAISAGAALYYAVRRKLGRVVQARDWQVEGMNATRSALEVREIEVEVVSSKER